MEAEERTLQRSLEIVKESEDVSEGRVLHRRMSAEEAREEVQFFKRASLLLTQTLSDSEDEEAGAADDDADAEGGPTPKEVVEALSEMELSLSSPEPGARRR